jgi:signal transduction histidine kinase
MKRKMKMEFCIVLIVFVIIATLGVLLHKFYDENSLLYRVLMVLDALVIIAFAFVSIHYFLTVKNNCLKYSKMEHFQHNMTAISLHDQISYILFDISKLKFYDWKIENLELTDDFDLDKFYSRVHPDDIETAKKIVQYALNKGSGLFSSELKFQLPNIITYSWQNIVIFPYENDISGVPLRYMLVFKNTDLVHKHMEDYNKMIMKVESADRMKSTFIHNISHEIRTPLNAVIGFLQLLDAGVTKEEHELFMDIIYKNLDMLIVIINDLISLSSLESGCYMFNRNKFDISSFMHDFIESMRDKIHEGLELKLIEHESYPVYLDPHRLSEVMNILLLNANKFTPSGNITVDYRVAGSLLTVSVADTGIGIAKEDQSVIFGKFEKISQFSQGPGLGLCIFKDIIDKVNGRIGVESEPCKGSKFWFSVHCDKRDV